MSHKSSTLTRFTMKVSLVLLGFIVMFTTVAPGFGQTAHAASTNLIIKMPNGGKFTHTKMDFKYLQDRNFSSTQIAALGYQVRREVKFLSPDMVKKQYNALALSVGLDMSKEYVKVGTEMAASYGIQIAKKKLAEKYGQAVATKLIPYLALFSWGYTAYDMLSTVHTGQELSRLAQAASANKGLVYESIGLVGTTFKWHFWDGSSQYGAYPNAKLNPTPYQFGDVKVF
ncbi:hypothetical protein [Paenibacillus sp. TSA_86.1]|uniref:hypothetical protein n=1 Tax=Paenibacillus sp. TSA_86.1 TaxID=3415649 RepID=UPI004045AC07